MPRKCLWALVIALSATCFYEGGLCDVVGGLRIAGSGGVISELAVPAILANATALLTPKYGPVALTFQSVDSPQDIDNVLTGADDFASSYIPLSAQQYNSAGRVLLQIPWAVSNLAIVLNVPGVATGQLRLSAQVLGGIYQCTITNWNDPAIAALNPNLTLPNLRVTPAAYSASKATTQILTGYLASAPRWTLGVGTQVGWPRCVQHIRTPDAIVDAVSKAVGSISWVADWRVNASHPITTALVQNAAGNWLGPKARFSVASLNVPASFTSPGWANVTFAASAQPDVYPLSSFLRNVVYQDVSAAGVQQAALLRDVMAYFVSEEVQSNLTYLDIWRIPPAMAQSARMEIAKMIVTPSNSSKALTSAAAAAPQNSVDSLVTAGVVVEGSGGASIQSLVSSIIANGTSSNNFGAATINFAPTDSTQGKSGVISDAFSFGISTIALTPSEIATANRSLVQVPIGFSPVAIVHSLPGVPDGALHLNWDVLSQIYQCTVTVWNDPLLQTLNPSLTLPDALISAIGLADASGTTSLMASYVSRSASWTLGTSTSLVWPRCVHRTAGGSDAVLQAANSTAYALGYASFNALVAVGPRLPVAAMMNRAGAFVTPYATVFPFNQDELPASISSPDWDKLDLNTTARSDKYPIGGLIYIMASHDLGIEGSPQGLIVQKLILYFLSDTVQANLLSNGAAPMIPSYLATERQQVAALNVIPEAAASPAGGAVGAQQGSSKAGFPWWAGLIIAVAAVAILAVAGLAAFLVVRRRRRQRAAAPPLEAVVHQKDEKDKEDHRFNRGSDDPPDREGRMVQSPPLSTRSSGRLKRTPSVDSDHLILVGGARVQGPPGSDSSAGHLGSGSGRLGRGVGVVEIANGSLSGHSSRSTSLPGSGLMSAGLSPQEKRRSISLPQEGTARSEASSMQSRGQSLQNEPDTHSLPGLLRARANSIDVDEVERGSLLGRGSFGKVYQGWWRGGTVAIKVVPHEGELGQKVDALRESLLCSAIQHPHIVTTYKVVTMRNGTAPQVRMRQETITENAPSYNSPDGSGGTGNTSMGSPSMGHLMETWIIMEYCDLGSLDNAISDGRFVDLEAMLLRLLDVAMGMEYLHQLGILHTDLKPSNVLLKTSAKEQNDATGCTAKLADFGLSRVLETNATHISTNTIGTIAYQPEEVLRDGHVTPASDVYSFAILLYEMYTHKHLFKGLMHSQMFFKVFNGYRPPIPPDMPPGLRDLMTAAWSHNPAERPSFRSIVKALQRLIREHRRAMGRATSMNLDEALTMEPAQLFPVAPAMPIKVPTEPPPPSNSSAESLKSRAISGVSAASVPAQEKAAPDEFEMALQDLRAKAAATSREGAAAPAAVSAAAAAPVQSSGFSAFAGAPAFSSNGSSSSDRGSSGRAAATPQTLAQQQHQQPQQQQQQPPPPRPVSRGKNYDLLLGD